MTIKIEDIDRRIWEEELDGFIPPKIFDAHTHVYLPQHCLTKIDNDPPEPQTHLNNPLPVGDRRALDACYAALCPGREVHYLMMPWVFRRGDFNAMNNFAAKQVAQDPMSVAFMIVHPSFSVEHVAQAVESYGFRGLKPYFFYVGAGDGKDCRITDMLPEPLIELADDKELAIMMHLGKSLAIADEENIRDLTALSKRYPKVKWILAHMARSLIARPLERAIGRIKDLPNLWYDFSSVCDSNVYTIAFRNLPLDRVMYGSDIPSDLMRGKLVGFGYAWALLSEEAIDKLDLSHCDGSPTFVIYETLRAARQAMLNEGFGRNQIEDIFYNNAMKLFNLYPRASGEKCRP